MATAMFLPTTTAIKTIGEKLVDMVPKRDFGARLYPYPGYGNHDYSVEKPTIICRWDGIADDKATERVGIVVPSALRYEVRIIHPSNDGPADALDFYANAQDKIEFGSGKFFEALANNRDMDELVLDVGVEASVIGDLIDPTTNQLFYGHEMVIYVKVWT